MVMQTNSTKRIQYGTAYHGDGVTTSAIVGYSRTLTVQPSPALNGSGRTHPNPFSFTIAEKQLPVGRTRDYYYWGNPSTRKRVDQHYEGTFNSSYWKTFHDGFPIPWWVANERNTVRNRCLSKLIGNLKSSDINLGTTVGEGRETYELFARLAKSVRHPLDALRSLKRSSRSHFGKNGKFRGSVTLAGSATLQMNLSISPMMSDIEGIMNHKLVHELPSASGGSLHDGNSWIDVDARSSAEATWIHKPDAYSSWNVKQSTRFEMGCQIRIRDIRKYEAWRAGLTAGPSLVWELTTLSWLVDYFFGVGKYLEALETAYMDGGFDLRYGYTTETMKREAEWSTSNPGGSREDTGRYNGNLAFIWAGAQGSGYIKDKSLNRTTWSTLPTPVYPSIKLPRASSQLLNCASILSGFLDKKR